MWTGRAAEGLFVQWRRAEDPGTKGHLRGGGIQGPATSSPNLLS